MENNSETINISCPQCGAKYRIASKIISIKSKKVRCNKCSLQWTVNIEDDDNETDYTEENQIGNNEFRSKQPNNNLDTYSENNPYSENNAEVNSSAQTNDVYNFADQQAAEENPYESTGGSLTDTLSVNMEDYLDGDKENSSSSLFDSSQVGERDNSPREETPKNDIDNSSDFEIKSIEIEGYNEEETHSINPLMSAAAAFAAAQDEAENEVLLPNQEKNKPNTTKSKKTNAEQKQENNSSGFKLGSVKRYITIAASIVIFIFSAIVTRGVLVDIYPKIDLIYTSLGAKPLNISYSLHNLSYRRENKNGNTTMFVFGNIKNDSENDLLPPRLRFSIHNHNARELISWNWDISGGIIPPGKEIRFNSRVIDLPENSDHIVVEVIKRDDTNL